MAKEKSRNFTFLLYPESLPEGWEETLRETDIPMAISPLHDRDLKESKERTKEDQFKKPHYHVIYVAKNPVTSESVRNKIRGLLGRDSIAKVQIIRTSISNTYAYFTHESSSAIEANKTLYDKKDIKLLNNFDVDRYTTLDVEDKRDIFNLLLSLIRAYGIANMFDLFDFVEQKGDEYGLPSMDVINDIIQGKSGVLKLYFDGAFQRSKQGVKVRKFD